jgi:hypothetical protein
VEAGRARWRRVVAHAGLSVRTADLDPLQNTVIE